MSQVNCEERDSGKQRNTLLFLFVLLAEEDTMFKSSKPLEKLNCKRTRMDTFKM